MSGAATWWLRSEDGLARRVTPGGLLIGRSPRCDIVVPSERVSRRQALVYLAARGPRLEILGRGATLLGGEPITRSAYLSSGDRLGFPGLELEVGSEAQRPARASTGPVWVLEDPGGALFGMVSSPFLVGGSAEDDLRVEGWPPGALCLRASEGGLEVDAAVAVRIDGRELAPGLSALRVGSSVEIGGSRVRVVTGGAFASGSTATVRDGTAGVKVARLEFLPRGGRLSVSLEDGEQRSVYLSDRRCDLLAVLLQPPEPRAPGEAIEDEVVIARVWGRAPASRTNLNVLLHRVRKDLARAGLDSRLVERAEGGGATRFVLAAGARVELD